VPAKRKKFAAEKRPTPANPTALSPGALAELLTRAGGREISPRKVREDVAAGAPTNADGTLHLMHYAAWLASQAD
jgi:hypothetical protein